MWDSFREPVIAAFPEAPGLPASKEAYLQLVDDIYQSDAYHSLSIEGYRVTPELIERVRGGNWNADRNEADRQSRDALAARGYWQAFQRVNETVGLIISGRDPGALVRTTHQIGIASCSSRASQLGSSVPARSPATGTIRCFYGARAMSRRAPRCCAMPWKRCSTCWKKKASRPFAPCSGTGCSVTFIRTPMAMVGWRVFS
jgi:hypothetical protein